MHDLVLLSAISMTIIVPATVSVVRRIKNRRVIGFKPGGVESDMWSFEQPNDGEAGSRDHWVIK